MNHNTIFIEGLPGSGKTTFAKRLKGHLENKGYLVKTFVEGDLHPLDLAWCSYCRPEVFHQMLDKYDYMRDEILKHTVQENGFFITAFTKIKHPRINHQFYSDWEQHEIYRSNNLQYFLDVHLKRWSHFAENYDPNTVYIFECVYLQNHINELILTYDAPQEKMIKYLKNLMDTIKTTKPLILYIKQNNIDKILNRLIDERRSNDPSKYRDWIDAVNEYVAKTNHGLKKGFSGTNGFRKYLHYRQEQTLEMMTELPYDYQILELDEDYNAVFEQIKQFVKEG